MFEKSDYFIWIISLLYIFRLYELHNIFTDLDHIYLYSIIRLLTLPVVQYFDRAMWSINNDLNCILIWFQRRERGSHTTYFILSQWTVPSSLSFALPPEKRSMNGAALLSLEPWWTDCTVDRTSAQLEFTISWGHKLSTVIAAAAAVAAVVSMTTGVSAVQFSSLYPHDCIETIMATLPCNGMFDYSRVITNMILT